jgi:hypothetical protein
MNKRETIKQRAKWERDAVKLAEKYASTNDYYEASKWYQAAGFHRAVREALEND